MLISSVAPTALSVEILANFVSESRLNPDRFLIFNFQLPPHFQFSIFNFQLKMPYLCSWKIIILPEAIAAGTLFARQNRKLS